jgi:hypothetical protein
MAAGGRVGGTAEDALIQFGISQNTNRITGKSISRRRTMLSIVRRVTIRKRHRYCPLAYLLIPHAPYHFTRALHHTISLPPLSSLSLSKTTTGTNSTPVSRPAGERREEKGRNHRARTARDCRHQACICRGGRRGRRPPPHEHAAVWEAAAAEHGEWKRR